MNERDEYFYRQCHEIFAKLILAGMGADEQSPDAFARLPLYKALSIISANISLDDEIKEACNRYSSRSK